MIKPPKLDDAALRRALRVLRQMEPDTVKQLKEEMATKLQSYADAAASQLPIDPALSGFERYPGWGVAKGKVRTVPSRTKKTGNKLVNIQIASTRALKTKGLLLAEFGGTKSSGYTPAGGAMIRNLNGKKQIRRKSGRYTYDYIRSERKAIVAIATKVLESYMKKASRFI